MLGKLVAHLPLVPQLPALGDDDEVTATAADQLELRVGELLAGVGGQTGRLRLVVSGSAVFDADVHGQDGTWPGSASTEVITAPDSVPT